ncbi:hypothetical protein MO867_04370 [Microbulbifer sp. OS29]|uniref:Uncharacterized protein n=1 Tax=Microbulbifer okhotskensis TaxID=2926617 RepID=A0A9X2J5G5_9GAMM|nr:hypothetical protein [Microbulbifer okhotskensis]MCO1333570.1 hypothetical protein [Microbulbifer okhotskensis]
MQLDNANLVVVYRGVGVEELLQSFSMERTPGLRGKPGVLALLRPKGLMAGLDWLLGAAVVGAAYWVRSVTSR